MNALTEKAPLNVLDNGEFNTLMDSDRFAQMQRVGTMFSQSDLVPEVFRGKPANCMVALQMAFRLKIDPLALLQSMYVVHGKPGLEAKMVIALINTRGPFDGPIQWRFDGEGKSRSCTAYATHRNTKERCEATVTWAMVEAEGWLGRTGSKWKTMPEIMFQYRSAAFLGRLYCPEVILGLSTSDELQDMGEIVINPPPVKKQVSMPRSKEETIMSDILNGRHGVTQSEKDAAIDYETGEISTKTTPETESRTDHEQPEAPPSAPASGPPASTSMKNIARKKMENAALSDADFEKKFGKPFEEMLAGEVNFVISWAGNPAGD